jgi:hypothetical protein
MNYVIIIIISFHLLGLDIFGDYMNQFIGYILFTFLFIYYCYGDIFKLTRKKLWKLYPSGYIQLRYNTDSRNRYITHLECKMVGYSNYWYELDKSMFGYIDKRMDVSYYGKHLCKIRTSDVLFNESERCLSSNKVRRLYDMYKSDLFSFRVIYGIFYIFYIFLSLLYFLIIVYR